MRSEALALLVLFAAGRAPAQWIPATPTPYPAPRPTPAPPTPIPPQPTLLPTAGPSPAPTFPPVPTLGLPTPAPTPVPAVTPPNAPTWVSLGNGFATTSLTVRNAPAGARARLTFSYPSGVVQTVSIPIGAGASSQRVLSDAPSGTTLRLELLTAAGTVVFTGAGAPVP